MTKLDKPSRFSPHGAASDSAPEVERIEVEAVGSKAIRQAYAGRQKIYAKLAQGLFRRVKWLVMAVTLGIYYLVPWVRWDRGHNLPDQAVLVDLEHQRLFFGPIEIWAQEFYLLTGVLVFSAVALFLVTSLAGRMWCGYTCPQTVWTDLMIAVERFWQGDRNARMRLDKAPWGFEKLWKKGLTHLSWLLIAVATGGAWVFYFRDAPTLAGELVTGQAPAMAYLFVGLFTVTTYLLGGIAREQVCIYMCPWPRIQGAMLDADSLLISYRDGRGEPRGAHKKGQSWEGRGDCVDCQACVAVCPMGIDIRDGPQLECIQCALCIDACDEIMEKVDRPRGLITYATFRNLHDPKSGPRDSIRLVRPRTVLYGSLLSVVGGLMLWAMMQRSMVEVNVLPDRNPLFVELSNGGIRNGYTVKILNKWHDPRGFHLSIKDIPDAQVSIVGLPSADPIVEAAPDNLRAVKIYVTVPKEARGKLGGHATIFHLTVTDTHDGAQIRRDMTFRSPEK